MAKVFDRAVLAVSAESLRRVCLLVCGSVDTWKHGEHQVLHGDPNIEERCTASFHACPTCPGKRAA